MPNGPSPKTAREVSYGIKRVGGCSEKFRISWENHFEHDGKNDRVLDDFPGPGWIVVLAEFEEPLNQENNRKEQRKADYVVEVALCERAADMVRFEHPAIDGPADD